MRTPQEIATKVAEVIRAIYLRPLMYARHPDVERTLMHYHWFWAVTHDCDDEWQSIWSQAYVHEHANAGIWSRFKDNHPDATDDEALGYTLSVWRNLSVALGVPLGD